MSGIQMRVTFRGRVQGVGFRWTTKALAEDYDVSGYVRNQPDGSVLLVAEGTRREVEHLLDALRLRMAGHIREETCETAPPTHHHTGFHIAF
ncbi:MAG: acylphosphatase [Planctomycetota bacterium]|jgi:acylphosphatase